MTHYEKCPNGCTGEMPFRIEGPGTYDDPYYAFIDEEQNAKSHDETCPPLTDAQIAALEEKATLYAGSLEYLNDVAEEIAEASLG